MSQVVKPPAVCTEALETQKEYEAFALIENHRCLRSLLLAPARLRDRRYKLGAATGLDDPDVWILTEADEGSVIEGVSRGAFVLRLKEKQWRPLSACTVLPDGARLYFPVSCRFLSREAWTLRWQPGHRRDVLDLSRRDL
jgi:hypothetical protein